MNDGSAGRSTCTSADSRKTVNAGMIAAHGINPALQPTSLAFRSNSTDSYRRVDAYQYGDLSAKPQVEVSATISADLFARILTLQDIGLVGSAKKQTRCACVYAAIDHQGARESSSGSTAATECTDEIVQTQ